MCPIQVLYYKLDAAGSLVGNDLCIPIFMVVVVMMS